VTSGVRPTTRSPTRTSTVPHAAPRGQRAGQLGGRADHPDARALAAPQHAAHRGRRHEPDLLVAVLEVRAGERLAALTGVARRKRRSP
jgi:hypothetical protein